MLVEEGEAVVEHPVCYTGGKERDQSEPVAVVGFEAEQRTAPSDSGRESPEAAAWESVGATVLGSGQEKRVTGWDATWWGSEEPAWVLQACSVAGWSDLVSEADCRRLHPSLADWEAGQEDRESRAVREGTGKSQTLVDKVAERSQIFTWVMLTYCVGWGLLKTWRWAISQCRRISTLRLAI